MTENDRERQLYDRYLDALSEHAEALMELRAAENRHIQEVYDPIVAMTERLPLKQAEHALYHHYERARRAYENYKLERTESNQ